MTRTTALVALLAGVVSGGGCCFDCLHSAGDRPLMRAMAGGPCATCGGACGARCRKVCGGECGDSCGDGCVPQGPIDHLHDAAMCGAGCDEVYWDEWVSDPPDCIDPCDDYGNWIGHQPCEGSIGAGRRGSPCTACDRSGGVPVEEVRYDDGRMYTYETAPPTLPTPRAAPVPKKAPPQEPRTIPYYDREAERSILKPIR